VPDAAQLGEYSGFHLLLGRPDRVELWSWPGPAAELVHRELPPGDHILVNLGLDTPADPLVPDLLPRLRAAAMPDPRPGRAPADAWQDWLTLLSGQGRSPDDPRALVIRHEFGGRAYGSTSASLIALSDDRVRYDFTATPADPTSWYEVAL
jgi:hypothetical protein